MQGCTEKYIVVKKNVTLWLGFFALGHGCIRCALGVSVFLCAGFSGSARKYSSMVTKPGARAALARSLISGRAYDPGKEQRVSVGIRKDVTDMAVVVGLCSDYGRGGLPSTSAYVEGLLIEAIREKRERDKKRLVEQSG